MELSAATFDYQRGTRIIMCLGTNSKQRRQIIGQCCVALHRNPFQWGYRPVI
jgi:hypothetical protein